MRSVADDLRRETSMRVAHLTVPERIALALSLGDADLTLYMKTSGKNRLDALRALRAQRARLRTPSGAAAPR
jgi:hypothetical protein